MRTIKELMSLEGRGALITGATGGIGQQIAITIAELGANLNLVDRPGSNYDDLLRLLSTFTDINVQCIDCDLENVNERSELIKQISNEENTTDILVNNAAFVGTSNLDGWIDDFEYQSVETWKRAIEVNLTAAFHLSKGLTPKLKERSKGSIINISSIYGISAPDYSLYESTDMGNPAAYAASKGGLIQLSRWLSTTLAPNIRVNAISPGGVFRDQPKLFVDRYESRTPLERMATEEDMKGTVAFFNLGSLATLNSSAGPSPTMSSKSSPVGPSTEPVCGVAPKGPESFI